MKTIHVRAIPRDGHPSFARGGHLFPDTGRTVRVTDDLYRVLMAEKLLAVSPPEDGKVEPDELALIDNRFDDRAYNASAAARASVEQLKAEKAALEAQGEVDKLKAEIDKLKGELAAKAAKAPREKL